jgi:hypothetical protein
MHERRVEGIDANDRAEAAAQTLPRELLRNRRDGNDSPFVTVRWK